MPAAWISNICLFALCQGLLHLFPNLYARILVLPFHMIRIHEYDAYIHSNLFHHAAYFAFHCPESLRVVTIIVAFPR